MRTDWFATSNNANPTPPDTGPHRRAVLSHLGKWRPFSGVLEAIEYARWSANLPAVALDLPDIEVLVKGTERGQLPCITLDPRILADVRKAFKVCGGIGSGDEALEFGFGPSLLHPVLITSEKVPALACIVMPRKPGDVDLKEDGETRSYVRRDTGEVVHSEPVSKQTCIAGTESDPVKESLDALQAAADATGEELAVHTGGGVAVVKPRKRGKKAEASND